MPQRLNPGTALYARQANHKALQAKKHAITVLLVFIARLMAKASITYMFLLTTRKMKLLDGNQHKHHE